MWWEPARKGDVIETNIHNINEKMPETNFSLSLSQELGKQKQNKSQNKHKTPKREIQ